ncbi:MAG: hypothetical protein JW969_09420 [Spirochaetales bacterium]|nr:hypothetical protein [Spirochaetales bacterium]
MKNFYKPQKTLKGAERGVTRWGKKTFIAFGVAAGVPAEVSSEKKKKKQ